MADSVLGASDPSLPLIIQELTVATRIVLPPSRDGQFVYVKKGRVFRRDDTGINALTPGTPVLIPPGVGTSLVVNPEGEGVRVLFGPPFLDQMAVVCWDERQTDRICSGVILEGREPVEISLKVSARRRVEDALDRMIEESRRKARAFRSLIRLAFIDVLITVCRELEREDDPAAHPYPEAGGMEAILLHIQENYAEAFTLTGLAEKCGLSPSYFSRAFKEASGLSPIAFINRIRIRKSCLLLKRSNTPILDVAYSVGYNNISFFNRYFRKIMKMSPREYRRYSQS